MKKELSSKCSKFNTTVDPVAYAMKILGGKWKLIVLSHLRNKEKRFNELIKEIPSLTDAALSIQLKKLEKDGLISRNVNVDQPPVKVFYKLTELGASLMPIFDSMTDWGCWAIENSGHIG